MFSHAVRLINDILESCIYTEICRVYTVNHSQTKNSRKKRRKLFEYLNLYSVISSVCMTHTQKKINQLHCIKN